MKEIAKEDGLNEYVQRINRAVAYRGEADHEDVRSILKDFLETQALAIEGMKDETKDPCSTVYNMSDWGKKCANEALQQAADHLRAQKTNTPTGGKN